MKQQRKKGYEWLRELPKRKQREWRREAHKQHSLGYIEYNLNDVDTKKGFFLGSFTFEKTKNYNYWDGIVWGRKTK